MARNGSRQIAVRLTMTEVETIRKTLRDIKDDGTAAMKALEEGAARATPAANAASTGMQRFSQTIGQAGYQVQDFATQVSMGGNALQALGVQGSQLLGAFGPAGAIAGAVLMVGTLATQFLTTADNAEQAKSKGQEALDAMAASAKVTAAALRDINDLFLTATQRAANLASVQRGQLRLEAEGRLGQVEAGSQELRRRLADAEGFLRDVRTPAGGNLYRAEDNEARNIEARAVLDVRNLKSELAAAEREAEKLRQGLAKLDSGAPTGEAVDRARALENSLDRRLAISRQYDETAKSIKENDTFSDERKQQLLTLALKDRDDAMKRLDESTKKTAASTREFLATAYEINEDGSQGAAFKRAASVETYLDRLRGRQEQQSERDDEKAKQARERAEKDQQRAIERAQRDLDRTAERWGDSMARETYSALETAFDKSKTPAQAAAAVFGSALRTAAQAALSQLVFQPAIKGVLGSLSGTGIGDAIGAGTTATSSGGVSYFDTASGLFKLSGGTGGGMVGGLVNSFDNWAAGSGLFATTSAPTSASAAAGLAGADPNAVAGLASNNGTLFGTASGTIGGVAGLAGGAYGIYSGINRGGVGGYTQALGGAAGVVGGLGTLAAAGGAVGGGLMAAAPWLAAAGPYGLAAAAVLAIVGSLLPGQKPSDMTGVYRGNLAAGTSEVTGLNGVRFSQENRDLATQIGQQVKTLAEGLQTVTGASAIPFNYEIKAGNRDGVAALYGPGGGTWREYERNEESIQQLVQDMTQALLDSMKGLASAEVQSVIAHSNGTEETLQNLDWYNGTYKQITAGARGNPISAFQQQLEALVKPIDEAIAKARSLGLSEAELNEVRAKSIDVLVKQRETTLQALQQDDEQRRALATGVSEMTLRLQDWGRAAQAEVTALNEQLVQLGLDQADRQPYLDARWATLDAERGSLERQQQATRAANSNALWDRYQAASGNADTLEGARWDYERRAQAEWLEAVATGMFDLTELARAQNEERLAIERRFNEQAAAVTQQRQEAALNAELQALQTLQSQASILTTFLDSQEGRQDARLGLQGLKRLQLRVQTLQSQASILTTFLDSQELSGPGVSPQQAFLAAQRQYEEQLASARNGGDLASYASAANTLIDTSAGYYGLGPQSEALRDMVLTTTRSLGASLDLPGFTANWEAGLARHFPPLTDAVANLTDRVNALTEELRGVRLRAA